jgi:hypothetical protein
MLSENGFNIEFAYVSWVPPLKHLGKESPKVISKPLDISNTAFKYFTTIFDSAINGCKIEIHFKTDGEQKNEVRDIILGLLNCTQQADKMKYANLLSYRLAEMSDNRNGTGLFVILEGKKSSTTRITLNRFREDEVVTTKLDRDDITVELLKQAFSKKSKYYKLAVYEDVISQRSFWKGFAIDRQRTSLDCKEISDYWIKDFLLSDQAINPVQGTRVLSKVIKSILKKELPLEEKEQIITGILALKHRADQFISIESFCKTYLSNELTYKLKQEVDDEIFFRSEFQIDADTYKIELGSKVTGLDNGVIVTAPTFVYDKYVQEEALGEGRTRVSVEGKIIDKRIDKAKRQ